MCLGVLHDGEVRHVEAEEGDAMSSAGGMEGGEHRLC